jgi:tRNA 2-thiouridine synthesizing protein A
MNTVKCDKVLDARGLSCPLPIVKARQEFTTLQPGQVLKVLATDRGSVKDFQGWAQTAKNIVLLGQTSEADNGREIYVHYVQKKA